MSFPLARRGNRLYQKKAMSSDRLFIERAIALAAASSRSGRNGPFGAVVAIGNRILGEGVNQVVKRRDPTAHAEVVALRAACRAQGTHSLEGCALYCSCEPCPLCLAAAYWARIERIVFACTREDAAEAGFDDALFYRELPLPWPERRMKHRQYGRRAGLRVLRAWKENPKKRSY